MNILDFYALKARHEKITMVTCYDYTSACLLADTAVDCLLVGDSVAMVMHGYENTLSATVEMMAMHTAAVKRGAGEKFIVTDLPFMSYRGSLDASAQVVRMLIQAGAHAVKLEGAAGNLDLIRHLTESGVPVMGHLGLTPQFINLLGGYKVQGKTQESAERLMEAAIALQNAGCFSLVLECVPALLAEKITQTLAIPTIGIGAGANTDGQVLVFQDLLGLNNLFQPKFVKRYVSGYEKMQTAVNAYVNEVKQGVFPQDEHSYQH